MASPRTHTRVSAAFPVAVEFLSSAGEPLSGQPAAGRTKDLSSSGMRLDMGLLPHGLAAQLLRQPRPINLSVEMRLGRKPVRLTGRSAWIRLRRRGTAQACTLGLALDPVPAPTAALMSKRAQRRARRAAWLRVTGGVLFASLCLAAALLGITASSHATDSATQQQQLREAAKLEQVLARELRQARVQLRSVDRQKRASEQALAAMERRVGQLRRRLVTIRRRHQDVAEVFLELGLVYELEGRVAEAVASYRHYLKLRPKASDAQQIRASIRSLMTLKEELGDLTERAEP